MSRENFRSERHAALSLQHPSERTPVYRIHAQHFTPPPAPKPTAFQKASNTMLTVIRLFRFYRASGMSRRRALARAVETVRRDRELSRSPR